jgi:Ca2+:H+ antiporter
VSVILTSFVSADGSSNWLLGMQLVTTYLLIGAVYLLEDAQPGAAGEATAPAPEPLLGAPWLA